MESVKPRLLRVGELAKAVGKSVRAIHLYEELGLLRPVQRTSGGFRLFRSDAVDRINWITKLQAIGFSLTEIQGFVREFENADSGRTATARVKHVFQDKLGQIRNSLAQLQVIENDLVEALEYLDSCKDCAPIYRPHECQACDHQGHALGVAPELFAGLSSGVKTESGGDVVGLARVRASASADFGDAGDEVDDGHEDAN